MVFYNCPRCGFQTELRANMTRHLTRKFSCQVILENISISECFQTILNEENNSVNKNVNKNENSVNKNVNKNDNNVNNVNINVNIKNQQYKCNFCEKIFSYRQSKYLHAKKCQKKDKNILILDDEKIKIIENLKTENEILKNSKNTTIQNNSITNNNNNNNTIIINAFGKENLKYIDKEYIHGLIREGPYGSIRKLIKYIHFNPDHKENHNIKIPNRRDKYAMVYDGKIWQVKNKKNMITTIADHAYGVIAEHCEDITSKKFNRFRDDFESDESRYMKRLAEDTELIILNGQNEIGIL
jgi:hypothetical protein